MNKLSIVYLIILVLAVTFLFYHKKVTQHITFINGKYVVVTEGYRNRFGFNLIYFNKIGVEKAEMVDSVLLNEEVLAKNRLANFQINK